MNEDVATTAESDTPTAFIRLVPGGADRLSLHSLGGTSGRTIRLQLRGHLAQPAGADSSGDNAGAQRALKALPGRYGPLGPAEKVGMKSTSPWARSQRASAGVLERNAAAGEILREAAPGLAKSSFSAFLSCAR